MKSPGERQPSTVPAEDPMGLAWVCTFLVVSAYVALMLMATFAPDTLLQPISHGSPITFGIVFGLFNILLCIVVSMAYTLWRNRGEQPR